MSGLKQGDTATMKSKKNVCVIVIICGFFSGCFFHPSDEDKIVLEQIKKKYGDKYSFEFDGDLYLSVISKTRNAPVHEVQEIYKEFVYTDFNKLNQRNTSYVYFNVCSMNGHFLYQLCYDPVAAKFGTGKTPHY